MNIIKYSIDQIRHLIDFKNREFFLFFLGAALFFSSCSKKNEEILPVHIIPQPASLIQQKGSFSIEKETVISFDHDDAKEVAELFAEIIRPATGFDLSVQKGEKQGIQFALDPNLKGGKEFYAISVSNDRVLLKAKTPQGLKMGIQSLRQLLPKEIEQKSAQAIQWVIPAVEIEDEPHFVWRGMHLDVSRHFFSKDYVKRYLDYMALYHLNTFHWHLTDDQGWRIEIKKYPELTEKGAFRTWNSQDEVCIENAKENPDFEITPEFIQVKDGVEVYGGYYTQDDIREIIAYASARGIEIIPEIDMPGHFKAAIDNYEEVSCFGKAGWGHTFSAPLCAGKEEAFILVENILSEVMALFPSQYMHIGADEVEKSNWKKCNDCQRRIKKEGLENEHELQAYFVKRIEKFINSKGKKMIGWDEILEGGMSPTATMMYWRGWVKDAPKKAVIQGNEVVMSPTSHCYFDHGQSSKTLKHLYGFDPVPEGLSEKEAALILGGQGNVWTEWIPSEARCDYMMMPRLLALSEALWSPKEQKDFDHFIGRATQHFDRLDIMGVNYRLPADLNELFDSYVFVNEKEVELSAMISDLDIRYTLDGTTPTLESTLYTGKFVLSASANLVARAFTKGGKSGESLKVNYIKKPFEPAVTKDGLKKGLRCEFRVGKGWKTVEEIGKLDQLKEVLWVKDLSIPAVAKKQKENLSLVYTGYLNIPEDGIYTFTLSSDDGSVVQIDGQEVINHDGDHGSTTKVGQAALSKGLHPIKLRYYQGGGGYGLHMKVMQNGEYVTIPEDWYFSETVNS